jgi:AraC family transcriptional regulator
MDCNTGMRADLSCGSEMEPISVSPGASCATSAWVLGARAGLGCRTGLVADESEWRVRPLDASWASSDAKVIATRWHGIEDGTRDARAMTPDDDHVVKIVLRNMNCWFSIDGRTVRDGCAGAGSVHVTEPGASARCLFRGPYDTLHLHVPNGLIDESGQDVATGDRATFRHAPTLTRDPTVERLGRVLLEADEIDACFGPLFADSVSLAIVMRLMGAARGVGSTGQIGSGLAKWRLKRTLEYIEAYLARPLRLAEIAAASGLSRMHFAAQFRIATGLRPHEYLTRRRIERAQEMLVAGGARLTDIALSVGFQSQAHFTTVFRRFVGRPPRDWSRSLADAWQDQEP